MKHNLSKFLNHITNYFYTNNEGPFKIWITTSWIIMLISYSLLIVAATLFGEAPLWIKFFGIVGTYFNVANFFFSLFLLFIFLMIGIKERDPEFIKTKAMIIFAYSIVACVMYFVVTI